MGYDGAGYNLNSFGVNTNLPGELVSNALKSMLPAIAASQDSSKSQLPSALASSDLDSSSNSGLDLGSMQSIFTSNNSATPYMDFNNAMFGSTNYNNTLLKNFGDMMSLMMKNMKTMPSFGAFSPRPSASNLNTNIQSTKGLDAKNLSKEDLAITEETAKKIGCDPYDLLAIMNNESGLNSQKWNMAGSKNVGLIQFGEAAASDMGTTTDALSKMDYKEQMVYVEKFYAMAKKRIGLAPDAKVDGATLYAMIFQPAKAGGDVLAKKGEAAYDKFYNYRLDVVGNDDKITKSDLAVFVDKQRKALGFDTLS